MFIKGTQALPTAINVEPSLIPSSLCCHHELASKLAARSPDDSQENEQEQELQLDAVLHVVLANWTSYDVPFRMYWATICALLQTSSSCRRAVQRTTAQCSAEFKLTDMQKLAQFCAWLPQHAGLVRSLSVQSYDVEPAVLAANWPAAEQLSCSGDQCLLLLALRSIQELHLNNAKGSKGVVTTELAVAVQQLQQLTSLSVEHDMHPELLQHLPTGIWGLCLRITVTPDEEFGPAHRLPAAEPVPINLQHLTRLTKLCLRTSVPLSRDSLLPQELITLSTHGPCNFHPSSKLERLRITAPQQSLGLMQFLPNLPQLRDLSVHMSEYYGAARDAEIAAVMAAVQYATQVRALDWNFSDLCPSAEENAVVATNLGIGSVLAGLTHLQQLWVLFPGIPESELSKLTALTALEKLDFTYCGKGVTDAVVVALASRLRKLQHLSLMRCISLSQAIWPALGSLTALTGPDVQLGPVMGDHDLQHLTTLTALQLLWVTSSLSDESKARFLAAMPQLTEHNLSIRDF